MFNTSKYADLDLSYQRRVKKIYEKELCGLPDGRLSVHKVGGRDYYYRHVGKDRTYIPVSETELIDQLKKKRFLMESIHTIDKNCKTLAQLQQSYQSIDADDIMHSLPDTYQTPSAWSITQEPVSDPEKWACANYRKNSSHPEALRHRTIKGDLVRSKSEVIIANALFTKGIPYRYDEVITIGDITVSPDFHILVPRTGESKLLEHFGMIHDESYRKKALWKIEAYLKSGFRPWENIIFTFDDLEGNIDAQLIDTILDTFCI